DFLSIGGNFEGTLGRSALLIEKLGAFELYFRKPFVCYRLFFILDRLAIVGKSTRNVRASYFEQKLSSLDLIAEPAIDFEHSSRCQRWHRNLSRYIRTNDSSDVQFRRRHVLGGCRERKAFRMVYLEIIGVNIGLDRRWMRTGIGVDIGFTLYFTASTKEARQSQT